MIYVRQIRAARALLNISQVELAQMAGMGVVTLRRIESSHDERAGSKETLTKLQGALEAEGIEFIEAARGKGPGVRLKNPILESDQLEI